MLSIFWTGVFGFGLPGVLAVGVVVGGPVESLSVACLHRRTRRALQAHYADIIPLDLLGEAQECVRPPPGIPRRSEQHRGPWQQSCGNFRHSKDPCPASALEGQVPTHILAGEEPAISVKSKYNRMVVNILELYVLMYFISVEPLKG